MGLLEQIRDELVDMTSPDDVADITKRAWEYLPKPILDMSTSATRRHVDIILKTYGIGKYAQDKPERMLAMEDDDI